MGRGSRTFVSIFRDSICAQSAKQRNGIKCEAGNYTFRGGRNMGRVLTVLGVLVLLVGIAGTVWSFLSPLLDPVNSIFNPAGDAVQAALEGPDAEKLCEPGETIETEEGPSSRTVGGTWGRP